MLTSETYRKPPAVMASIQGFSPSVISPNANPVITHFVTPNKRAINYAWFKNSCD